MLTDVPATEAPDLYPSSEEEQTKVVARWSKAFQAAEDARQPHEERWYRWYQLSRSFVPDDDPADWHSKVFIPLTFFTIQTILPRLVAGLPRGVVYPVGPEDVPGAAPMEELLEWSADQSSLDLELVKAYHSALTYGTGVLKTSPMKRSHMRTVSRPKVETYEVPSLVRDPATQAPLMDLDQQPLTEMRPFGERPVIDPQTQQPVMESSREEVISYVGPVGESCDIFNIYPAPEAEDVTHARYIIYRRWADKAWVEEQVENGTYRLPPDATVAQMWSADDDPQARRASEVDLGSGRGVDTSRDVAEVWECWHRDGTVTTILNQKMVVRLVENPFDHGEFPFVRIVDHLNPHEFWGTGEIEHLEGIQDSVNAIWNQRIDNVRLILNKMFYVRDDAVEDKRDLRTRPGGLVRVSGDNFGSIDEAIRPVDFGDVTTSSYEEVNALMDLGKTITGANDYSSGQDPADATNQTATGAAILTEQGNIRFQMKVQLAEMTGLRSLMRQYGALLQQFTPAGMTMRVIGPDGTVTFKNVDQASLAGAFDYDIEAESSTVTESMRREQSMGLLNLLAGTGAVNVQALIEDVLRDFGKKDIQRYMGVPAVPGIDPATGLPAAPGVPAGEPAPAVPPGLEGLEPAPVAA